MSRRQRTLLTLAIIACCVSCDQVSKGIATEQLANSGPMDFGGGALRLQYAENPGAFLGLCDALPHSARTLLLSYIVAASLAGFLAYLLRARALSVSSLCACALVCGGGIGNLIDRFTRDGLVVDFLNCGLGGWRTGIFNVADMAILAGALWLFGRSLWEWSSPTGMREPPA